MSAALILAYGMVVSGGLEHVREGRGGCKGLHEATRARVGFLGVCSSVHCDGKGCQVGQLESQPLEKCVAGAQRAYTQWVLRNFLEHSSRSMISYGTRIVKNVTGIPKICEVRCSSSPKLT